MARLTPSPFTRSRITRLRHAYRLKDRRTRLIEAGMLTPSDVAVRCGVEVSTVHLWRRQGLLRAHPANDKGDYLYELPPTGLPVKYAHKTDCAPSAPSKCQRNPRSLEQDALA
jgi:hypothetical protein